MSGWWWRERRDGTRAPGYLVYLAAGVAALVAIELVHDRLSPAPVARRRSTRSRGADVSSVTDAAARMSPVPPKRHAAAPGTRSYRLKHRDEASNAPAESEAADDFDPIRATLAGAAPESVPEPGPRFPPLQPALLPQDPSRGDGPQSRPQAMLLVYRDASADIPDGGASHPLAPVLLPRASLIPVYLLTVADTGNPAAILDFAVSRNVMFGGRCVLPFGTRLLGRLSGGAERDRLNLVAESLLYPDGSQVAVKAAAVEAGKDGSDIYPGVAAIDVPPPAWVQMAPYLSDFFTGAMGILQSRAQGQLSVGLGPLNVQTSSADDLRGPAYQASAQAVQDFVANRLKEVERRYAAYQWIPAGTAFWFQLLQDLPLPAASIR